MNGQEGFFFAASLSISLLRHVGKGDPRVFSEKHRDKSVKFVWS